MSSGSPLMFWLSAFVWDFINYLIPVVFLIGVLMIFQVNQLIGEERIFYLLIILSLYGMAHIPQAYLFSLKFDVPSNGFSFITAWNIMSSQIGLIIIQILSIPSLGNSHHAEYIEPIFSMLFPNFAMGQSIIDMHNNFENLKICQDAYYGCRFEANPCCRYSKYLKREKPCGDFDCLYWNSDYWSWQKPGLSLHAFNMFIQFLINSLLLILIETSQFKKLTSNKISKKQEFKYLEKDSDVEHEEKRIQKSIENNTTDTLIVSNLSKFYSNFHAVKNISFGVNVNECFGFLGLNGAGKSSTFKMITGEEAINEGQIIINKINIKHDPDKFRCLFGYCPQTDPLIEQMTVLETIEMFAKLRGIKKELVLKTSLSLIELLDLKEHENKMCFTLSGGNKRKLSVAISLVGSPSVILLDEPSSMDEAEALCSKVSIMVNGELKCHGSLQHLKNKYGDGFTLEVRIKSNNFRDFIEFMKSSFDFCEVNETRDSYMNFKINTLSKKNSLSNIFSVMESSKKKFSIQHYCLSQTNLEQIFFKFVSSQLNHDK
ncbi:unnamed protein product [Brachionus calyciflorus]|uniref:ABC transporter domain-containing protein n=1 Tax=Brachionus calyciflorus TaxID=104777 RepID=A0A814JMR9_9BILA|nr:unnamed protein product [Brachionus calyciflorus]